MRFDEQQPEPTPPPDSTRAASDLYELLEQRLRGLASASLRRMDRGHTLQTTAVLNEVWMRIREAAQAPDAPARPENMLALGASAIRSVLVDHARKRHAQKRGAGQVRVPIEVALESLEQGDLDLVELNDALELLAKREPRQARIVELRFFGGLTIEETARVEKVSHATVQRDWRLARMWLLAELGEA